MANHISALKRIRQNEKRRLRNRQVRQTMRTRIKQARTELAQNKDQEASHQKILHAISHINKAASKGVIHKKAASRKISRLAQKASKELGKSI